MQPILLVKVGKNYIHSINYLYITYYDTILTIIQLFTYFNSFDYFQHENSSKIMQGHLNNRKKSWNQGFFTCQINLIHTFHHSKSEPSIWLTFSFFILNYGKNDYLCRLVIGRLPRRLGCHPYQSIHLLRLLG